MAELLCVGQIGADAIPVSEAGKFYYKVATSYGVPGGAIDPTLVFESQDFAPMGQVGRCIARRLYVAIEYAGSCTVRITPITDLNDSQPPTSFSLVAPSGRKRIVLEVPLAKPCTYVRCKFEVLARTGLVWLHGIRLAHLPLASNYEQVAGADV